MSEAAMREDQAAGGLGVSPWESVLFSFFVPGAGQIRGGRVLRGLAWFGLLVVLFFLMMWLLITPLIPSIIPAYAGIAVWLILWAWMIVDAYRVTPAGSAPARPAVAALLSAIVPGIGQFLIGAWGRGLVFMAVLAAALLLYLSSRLGFAALLWAEAVCVLALALAKLYAPLDAYLAGMRGATGRTPSVWALAGVILLGAVLTQMRGVTERLVHDTYYVKTVNMEPTLAGERIKPDRKIVPGDTVVIDKLTYRFRPPARGELVLFRFEAMQRNPYVLRVAGVPGDRVNIQPPFVFIRGKRLTEPPIFRKIALLDGTNGGYRFASTNVSYAFLKGPRDNVDLEAGQYFLLGDNTRNSFDSRYWGPVAASRIEGRVTKVLMPIRWGGKPLD